MNDPTGEVEIVKTLFILGAALLLYFIPWLIAVSRSHRNSGAIFALNLLLGWTGLGWIIAVVWSLTNPAPSAP